MITGLFTKLFLAIIFGATIGLEREGSHRGPASLGGIRTYSLIALLGAMAGLFFLHDFSSLTIVMSSGFLILLVANYVLGSITAKDFGISKARHHVLEKFSLVTPKDLRNRRHCFFEVQSDTFRKLFLHSNQK